MTDVAAHTVGTMLIRDGIKILIHGHPHRRAVHCVSACGTECNRIVLGDWYEQGSVLRVDGAGCGYKRWCDCYALSHPLP